MRLLKNNILLLGLITPIALSAAPYFCGSSGTTYSVSAMCNSACGQTCEELDPNPVNAGMCDTANYSGFVSNGSKTYALSKTSAFWTEFGNLAIPTNTDINNILKTIAGYYSTNAWIGVYDPLKSDSFNTVDPSRFMSRNGSALAFSNWAAGEPNNLNDNADIGAVIINGEHWAIIGSSGGWYDKGYHVSLGGDYTPRYKALEEWNGQLDCVSGVSKATTSTETGIWCSDGTGNIAECNVVSSSTTPICVSPAVWNPTTQKCETGGTYTYPAYYSGGTRVIDITSNRTLTAGIDFPASMTIQICMAGGGGSSAPRSKKDDGAGGGSGAVLFTASYKAGTKLPAVIGAGGSSGVCGERGGTSTFGGFSVGGGYNGCLDSGGAATQNGGKGGDCGQNGGNSSGCGGSYVGGLEGTVGDHGGGGGAGGFGNGPNDEHAGAPNTGAGAGGRGGLLAGGSGRIKITVPAYSCDPGDMLIGTTCTKDSLIQTDGTCNTGYTLIDGECVKDTQECPLGNYQCYEVTDGSKVVSDSVEGVNDKQNDGEVDSSGNCLGQIYIFNGQDNRCRPPGIQTGFSDCCQKGDTWFGLGQCNEKEKTLGALRDFGELDGNCHEVGTYCAEEWPLIGCVQDKKTYCCFSSPLARIIHEGGRPQLGIGWGEPESPQCRGFTPEEFQKIDFSKVDFSEWIQYQVEPNIQNGAVGNIQRVS